MENNKIDFSKENGLVPAIIQNERSSKVLMLGYMNEEAFDKTVKEKKVTFFSRSKNRLWTKGEESGNYLIVKDIKIDCDGDTLLINVEPLGPTCHTGSESCFKDNRAKGFLYELEKIIEDRIGGDSKTSYTKKIFDEGINKVAQKVGEEAVEVIISAKENNADDFKNEVSDLLYHLIVLLKAKGVGLEVVEEVLKGRRS